MVMDMDTRRKKGSTSKLVEFNITIHKYKEQIKWIL